ncbi:MAG TPA: diacylglycerol kinase family protein [Albidovulum sp.]|uniref:diacylglycerol/lipid kinase family protein n=1 Tax=Albidovulum sp. TaxID=1872424 RepID=UPI002C346041|nr:diacylglycerol kinase family protein [Albidovulum sp.]
MTSTFPDLDLARAKVTLILNAKAGKKDADARVEEIRARLEPAVGKLILRPVRGSEIARAARAAVDEGSDVVAALGGDGTQSAVAGALAGTDAVMAPLPGGTFNYFARELGLETLDDALDALLAGKVEARDVGTVNDRVFLNNLSFGLYPHMLQRREAIYDRWGRSRLLAYWSALLSVLNLRDPMHLSLTVDGQQRDIYTPLAFIARSAYQLESFGMDGAKAVRDGHFALFVARGKSRRALMAASIRLALGKVARGEDFDLVISDEMLIETRRRRKLVALDGEKARMSAPFRLAMHPGALKVVAPVGKPGERRT